jgi:hypothetical protein
VIEEPSPELRCGYPKKDGSPCKNRVRAEGKVCRVHQKAALLDRILKRDVVLSRDESDAD